MNNTEKFMILPPPNVTGKLHCGHFLMTSILDLISRMHNVILKEEMYICPGTDHGGIAMKVAANNYYYQHHKRAPTEIEIEILAHEYKSNIEESLRKWPLQFDWTKNHYTMNNEHSEFVTKMFCLLYDNGYIYRKKALINWDTGFKTAISDIEVDMIQTKDPLYFIEYTTSLNDILVVSTTRPETIFADVALMINPHDIEKQKYIGQFAYIPIINKKIPILADEYVDIKFGTGVLKVTPGHDVNDYALAIKYKLPIYNIFNNNNEIVLCELDLDAVEINNISKKFVYGNNIYKVRKAIVEYLNCKYIEITHNVPISSRSKERIENCMQEQWFMNMSEAAQLALHSNIEYYPTECFKNNIAHWLNNIQDWCLSRSLPWGHAMPVWHGPNNEIIVSPTKPNGDYTQTTFRLDTWFSSALWPLSYENKFNIFPFNTLVTGYDILFFWVARMIMITLVIKKIQNKEKFNVATSIPFNKVYLHGLVRDSKGQKMSKTLNNVKDPNEEITKLCSLYPESDGYDILRLSLLLQVSPNNHVKMIDDPLRARNILTKVNNLASFIQNKQLLQSYSEPSDLKQYFMYRLQYFKEQTILLAKNTNIHLLIECIINFLYEICDILVEFSKVDLQLCDILQDSFTVFINAFELLCPNTSKKIQQNIKTSNIINISNISSQDEHYTIKIISQLRTFKTLKIQYYYDGLYKNIINKLCNNICEYNDTLHKIIISNQTIYIKVEDMSLLNKYIEKQKNEYNKIQINDLMPDHIRESKINIRNQIQKELNVILEVIHA